MTNYSRSVLKSNGLHRPKIRLKKFGFSSKSVPANIAKKLPLQCCTKPLLIPFFNFSHKRPTFAFTGESGYTLAFANRIAHSGLHGETGVFWMGALLLPSERSTRSRTSPGRVSERQTLPLLGLGRGCAPEERRVEMSRNVQSGNTQNLKSMVIQSSFPKWSVAERRKTAAASN